MWLEYIKVVHVSCALLTGLSFFLRGILVLQDSSWCRHRLTRVLPHVIDTLLLLSALALLYGYGWRPLELPWLLGKILALLLYIGLGLMAFRFAQSRAQRLLFWLLALVALGHIYFFALSRSIGWVSGVS